MKPETEKLRLQQRVSYNDSHVTRFIDCKLPFPFAWLSFFEAVLPVWSIDIGLIQGLLGVHVWSHCSHHRRCCHAAASVWSDESCLAITAAVRASSSSSSSGSLLEITMKLLICLRQSRQSSHCHRLFWNPADRWQLQAVSVRCQVRLDLIFISLKTKCPRTAPNDVVGYVPADRARMTRSVKLGLAAYRTLSVT